MIQHIESVKGPIREKGKPKVRCIKSRGAGRYGGSQKKWSCIKELEQVDGRSGLRIRLSWVFQRRHGLQVSTRPLSSEYGTNDAPESQGWRSFAHVFSVLRIGEARVVDNTPSELNPKKHSRVLNIFQAQAVRRDTSLEDLCSSSERCTVPPLNVASLLSRPTSASQLNGYAHWAVSLGTCPTCTGRPRRTRIWRWSVGRFVSQHFEQGQSDTQCGLGSSCIRQGMRVQSRQVPWTPPNVVVVGRM